MEESLEKMAEFMTETELFTASVVMRRVQVMKDTAVFLQVTDKAFIIGH